MTAPGGRDGGFALIAAVAAVAAFGYIAFAMMNAERGNLALASGLATRARLAAAADAGLEIAVARIGSPDARERWHIDSRLYRTRFDGIGLTIRIEDERGKIRLNQLEDRQVEIMFEAAGARGRQAEVLRDSFLDWRDDDDQARPNGAEAADYAGQGIAPRNGTLRSVGELARIRGMTRPIYDRIAPAATVFFGNSGSFSPETGQPLAIAVMTGLGMGAPEVIERQRELAGQRTAISDTEEANIAARPLTVRVLAEDGNGGRLSRATIIEFPRGRGGPWVIRLRG